jgi:hypothetical protein
VAWQRPIVPPRIVGIVVTTHLDSDVVIVVVCFSYQLSREGAVLGLYLIILAGIRHCVLCFVAVFTTKRKRRHGQRADSR